MGNPRIRALLAVAALLLLLRMIVVPWVGMQAEQRDRLQVLTARLDRSEAVVQNEAAIGRARKQLEVDAGKARARFPGPTTSEEYRLAAQKAVAAIAAAVGVTVEIWDWTMDGKVEEAGLAYGRARVRLDGPLQRLIRAHGELEAGLPNGAVREFTLEMRNPASGPDETIGSATFMVDLYYRPATSRAAATAEAAK